MKVTNDPVDGCTRLNCVSVFPSSAIAIIAAMIVSGAGTPAVAATRPKPKKNDIAGAMFAIVEVAMSTFERTPRARRLSRAAGLACGLDSGLGSTGPVMPTLAIWSPLLVGPHDAR